VVPYIDWTFFFSAWELKGRFPGILQHPEYGAAARELYGHARTLLDRIVAEKLLTARGVYGFWPANAEGDDIVVYADDSRRSEVMRFPMLRQQEIIADAKPNRSLADFIDLLTHAGVTCVVDVRAYPHSRRNPHFSRTPLMSALNASSIRYMWEGEALGGMRRSKPDSLHVALTDVGFRGFADHIASAILVRAEKRAPAMHALFLRRLGGIKWRVRALRIARHDAG